MRANWGQHACSGVGAKPGRSGITYGADALLPRRAVCTSKYGNPLIMLLLRGSWWRSSSKRPRPANTISRSTVDPDILKYTGSLSEGA